MKVMSSDRPSAAGPRASARPHSYRFRESTRGFSIVAQNRDPMFVQLAQTGFEVHSWKKRQRNLFDLCAYDAERFRPTANLFSYQRLVKHLAEGLMANWRPPNGAVPPWFVREAALKATRKAIGRRVHDQWRRLLADADPCVAATQKSVFCTGSFDSSTLHVPQLYKSRFLIRDIQSHRAAASIVAYGLELYRSRHAPADDDPEEIPEDAELVDGDALVDFLIDWQSLCAPEGRPYGSLRRTLMQLPGGIPSALIEKLRYVRLERAVPDRVELLALLFSVNAYHLGRDPRPHLERRFLHANRTDVIESLAILSEHFYRPLSARRAGDIGMWVNYLGDCPEDYQGKLSGFTRRAIRWHRDCERRQDWGYDSSMFAPDRAAALPVVPLPSEPGIQFLDSVEAIRNEGARMQHCIASYAEAAVEGKSYLFHVEYEGESASAEVLSNGIVNQCFGPSNRHNAASEYGVRVLASWGRRMAERGRTRRSLRC